MSDFKTRLQTEREELEEKISKLSSFVRGQETNMTVSHGNLLLLQEQLVVMERYLNILIIRIELIG